MSLRDGARRIAGASTSIAALAAAALLPKCPLCIAAALSTFGVGAAIGGALAPFARPFGIAVAIIALLALAWPARSRRKRTHCTGACASAR